MKYKNNINNILTVAALLIALCSCNRDEVFDREQYKHVISLMSEGVFNIFSEEHYLAADNEKGITYGHIAASCGGSLSITEPATLRIVEDASLLASYNNNNYAMESFKYANYLSPDRYTIADPSINIQAHELTGRMKIQIRAGGLSPDSMYFIPFRVSGTSAYELNYEKSTVMYRIYVKNFWASTMSVPKYNHTGKRFTGNDDNPTNTIMQKDVFPVSGNEVRIFAGTKAYEAKEITIRNWAIRLVMDANNNVTILPWDKSGNGMKVKQIDGDPEYSNIFRIFHDPWGRTFKEFWLHYEYIDGTTKYRMQEKLSIEYVPEVK